MSGDVQPRKRKDKRRKKEGETFGTSNDSTTFHKPKNLGDRKTSDFIDQGEKIHVQNEQGIGGNICFKIVFFCLLFALLTGIAGIVYKLSQDSTDVEPPSVEESRFAEYFAGWVDDNSNDHDHDHEVPESVHDNEEHNEGEEEEEGGGEEEEETHDSINESEDQNSGSDLLSSFFSFGGNKESVNSEDTITESSQIEGREEAPEEDEADDDDDDGGGGGGKDEDEDVYEKGNGNYDLRKIKNFKKAKEKGNDHVNKDNTVLSSVKDKIKKIKLIYNIKSNRHAGMYIGNDKKSSKKMWKKLDKFDFNFGKNEIDHKKDRNENYYLKDLEDDDDDDGDDEKNEIDENEENYDASQIDEEEDINDKYKMVENTFVHKKDDQNEEEAKSEVEENNKSMDGTQDSDDDDDDEDDDDDDVGPERSYGEMEKNIEKGDDEDLGYDLIDESDESSFGETLTKEKVVADSLASLTIEESLQKKVTDHKLMFDENRGEEEVEVKEQEKEKSEEDKEFTEETGGVVVKLGVGIALIIVAHLVLVQKWKARGNVSPDEITRDKNSEIESLNSEPEPVISRRQTLVPEGVEFDDEEEDVNEKESSEVEEDLLGEEEEKEEEDEYFKKDNKLIEKHIFDKPSLEQLNPNDKNHSYNFGLEKVSIKNQDDEFEELDDEEEAERDGEEEEEEVEGDFQNYEDDDYGDEEEYEYDEGDYGEEEEEEDQEEEEDKDFEMEIDHHLLLGKEISDLNLGEDVTPVPPPRVHKRGGQDSQEELENRSDEVLQEEYHRQEDMTIDEKDENVSEPEPEPELSSAERKVGDEEDWAFRQDFQYADEQFENNPKAALRIYDEILKKKPTSLKALIYRARVLDHIAELEKSNAYLKQATNAYKIVLINDGHRLDDEMYEKLAERCISRMRFGGHHTAAIDVHKGLIARFPDNPKYRNTLAVTYLMQNRIEPARWILNETLTRWPKNGFALVHYGFIVKTTDNNMEEGARLLMEGMKTNEEGVNDGMFFFHLGDALTRLGRPEEALKWYDKGVKEGLFLSRYQRSLYNINRLIGRPWWTKEQTTYKEFFDLLEKNWREIRKEGLNLLNSKGLNLFKEESENLKDTGDWRQLDLYFRGRKQANCEKAPVTCSLVSSFKAASRCTRGQIKFSVMLPKTHVWPHCGPTNCRLRSHLGLVVPPKTFIRVAEETRSWQEGKIMIFDDSFEHEVWHNGTGLRLVLIVDVWHPDVTEQERRSLSPI